MLDMLNDLSVMVILLFWLGKDNILVKLLAASYGAMTLGAYLPVAFGIMSQNTAYIVLEIIGILHIIIIAGGASHGYRNRFFRGLLRADNIGAGGDYPAGLRRNEAMRKTFSKDGTLTVERDS